MSRNFAVVKNGVVENVIVADSIEVAQLVAPDGICVEITPQRPGAMGWAWDGQAFTPPQPFPSWVLNAKDHLWEPPILYPPADNNLYIWDEPTVSWKAI